MDAIYGGRPVRPLELIAAEDAPTLAGRRAQFAADVAEAEADPRPPIEQARAWVPSTPCDMCHERTARMMISSSKYPGGYHSFRCTRDGVAAFHALEAEGFTDVKIQPLGPRPTRPGVI